MRDKTISFLFCLLFGEQNIDKLYREVTEPKQVKKHKREIARWHKNIWNDDAGHIYSDLLLWFFNINI